MADELFFFDRDKLVELALAKKSEYLAASPFPSIVMDGFFPREVAEKIAAKFPPPSFSGFKQPDNAFQKNKLGRTQENYLVGLPPFIRHLLNELNGLAFIDFLENLTGIHGLIPDTHFKGGALHQILPGGSLAIHADFNRDPYRKLDRRINVLLYFNQNWDEAYGGELELWDSGMSKCEKRIAPVLNRIVIFNTSSTSFHGHPEPLKCPEGKTRNSIALYYYTNGRDGEVTKEHSTLWRARPGTSEPEGEADRVWTANEKPPWKERLRSRMKPWVPPALIPVTRKLLN